MITTEALENLYRELTGFPAARKDLDALDRIIYQKAVRNLPNDAAVGLLISELRRTCEYRPTAARVEEIADSLLGPDVTLPPVQAQAYRQIGAPQAVGGKGDTIRALVDHARPDDNSDEGWKQIQKEQPGRFQFLKTVAMLVSRKDVKKRPDYQPAPGAGSRRTLLSSLRAAGLLISAAETLQPDDRAAADAELQRIRETKDVFASLYCLLSTDKWTPYHRLAAETDKEKIARIALDTGLKLMMKRGKVEMKSDGGVSLWRLVEMAEENEAERERLAA